MTTIEKHLAMLRSGVVDKTTVAGLRKALNALERRERGYSVSRTSTCMTEGERDYVDMLLIDKKPKVVGALHDSGVALLRNKRYARQLAGVKHVVDDLQEFRLVEFQYVGQYMDKVTPVYRAINSHGEHFDFTNLPWQSGGNGPQVL